MVTTPNAIVIGTHDTVVKPLYFGLGVSEFPQYSERVLAQLGRITWDALFLPSQLNRISHRPLVVWITRIRPHDNLVLNELSVPNHIADTLN